MNTLQKKKLRGTGVNCGLIVLLVVIIFRPRGILGTYEFSLDRLLFDGRLAGKKKAKARKGGADA